MIFRRRVLVLAWALGACDTPKQPGADSTAVPNPASTGSAPPAVADVPAYLAAKATYTKSYQAHWDSAKSGPGWSDSAMKDLEIRLRAIVGPVSIGGRPVPTKTNVDGLLLRGSQGGGELDGLRVAGDTTATIIVSTGELLVGWLHSRWGPGDPLASLKKDDVLTQAFWFGAAVQQYADIAKHAELPADVFVAKLALLAQDYGPWPPDEVFVGVRRGERIFLVAAPARVKIPVPSECSGPGQATFYECYDRVATADPAFARIVAQVREIIASLPDK